MPEHVTVARPQCVEVAVLGPLIDNIRRDPVDVDRGGVHRLRDHDVPEINAPQDVKLRGIAGTDRALARVVARSLLIKAVGGPAHAGRRRDRCRPSQSCPDHQGHYGEPTHVELITRSVAGRHSTLRGDAG